MMLDFPNYVLNRHLIVIFKPLDLHPVPTGLNLTIGSSRILIKTLRHLSQTTSLWGINQKVVSRVGMMLFRS